MKGQWFIISAVIASSAFLGISLLLKDYFVVDSSYPAGLNNDFYLNSVAGQLDNIIKNTVTDDPPTCVNLTTNLNELKTVATNTLASKGLFFYMNYTVKGCDATNDVDLDFMVASQNEVIYNFTKLKSPSQVIG